MSLSLNTGSAILKTFYLPPLQRLFNRQTILWDRLERNDKWNPEGKSFTLALHYGRHPTAASGRPNFNASLPTNQSNQYANSTVPTAYLYTRIQVEGPIIEHARSNAGSFVRAVRSEIEGAAEAHRKSMNRQANGNGLDALGNVVVGGTSTSFVLDDGATHHTVYLQPGVVTPVDIYDVTGTTLRVAAVNATLGAEVATGFNVTLGSSQTLTALDILVLPGSMGFQMTGLRAILATTDPSANSLSGAGGLQGLAVASAPYWVAQVIGTPGISAPQDLRFPLLQKVISRVAKNSPNGKDDIKFILASFAGQDIYYELANNERIAVNTMVLDGGFEGVEFSGIPIVADPEHWDGYFDFIVPDALRINQVKDVDWMDKDGNVLFRVSGADAYEATLYAYMNVGTTMRNSLGTLAGINM
jgi:hypothetical protein